MRRGPERWWSRFATSLASSPGKLPESRVCGDSRAFVRVRSHGLAGPPSGAEAREESRRPQARPRLARSGNHGSGAVYTRGSRIHRPRLGSRARAPQARVADTRPPPPRWPAPGAGPSGSAGSRDPPRARPRTSDNVRANRSSPACEQRKRALLLGEGHTGSCVSGRRAGEDIESLSEQFGCYDRESGKGDRGLNADDPPDDAEFRANACDCGIKIGFCGGAFVAMIDGIGNGFGLAPFHAN